MKKIMIIKLDNDSQQIVDSLQKFYEEKAEVNIMEITDKPQNIDIFFFRGTDIIFNEYHKKLLNELVYNNDGCKTIAYFDRNETDTLHQARLVSRFGGEGKRLFCDESICKVYLLEYTWYEKDRLLGFLVPPQKTYYYRYPSPEEWAEY